MPSLAQTIPVLDLQDFYGTSSDRQTFVQQLGSALEEIGFFAVVNHGVDAALIKQAYQVAAKVFDLPEAIKRQYEYPELHGQRGFTRFGREHAKHHPVPDLKEFWHVGRELAPGHPLADQRLANVQIAEVPEFHPVTQQLYTQLEICAIALLRACALYLDEPEILLSDMVQDGDTILRIIHYPAVPAEAHPASLRAAPHEDINLITLLCEATDDGLELLQRDGTWLPVRAVPGQIIVDSGDMLQQLTNGLLKSTTHRVVNPRDDRRRRFSMPFFVHPRPEVDLTPLPQCVQRTGKLPFPSITAAAYLQQRLQEIGLQS
jgi:isopenicillin N synthase-like dioxygenase